MTGTVAVVGASLAGLSAARALRGQGWDGRVVLIGDEPHRPYDRPPLSKDFLAGSASREDIDLTGPDDDALDLDWRLGTAAVALDAATRTVRLADGSEVRAEGVVLATGARARTLPGGESHPAGVHVLRSLDDALALREDLQPGRALVVIGAGFIGAEVASTARGLGLDVTVVEALPVPLAGPLGPEMGAICGELHGQHGTRLLTSTGVTRLVAAGGRVTGVELSDGRVLPADVVVVGIGAQPNVEWLAGSGLTIAGGVVTDARGATDLPGVVAVGDCAARWSPRTGRRVRTEHWDDALRAPTVAAASLLGTPAVYDPVPYVWSEQFGRYVQWVGWRSDGPTVWRGDPAARTGWAAAWLDPAGRLTGLLSVDRQKDAMQARRVIDAGRVVDPDRLADPGVPIRSL